MNFGGWLVMLASVIGVTGLFAWSLYLAVTKEDEPEHLHSTLDTPPDLDRD